MKYRKVMLKSGSIVTTVHLPDVKTLRIGNELKLKDHKLSDRWWTITWIADKTVDNNYVDFEVRESPVLRNRH